MGLTPLSKEHCVSQLNLYSKTEVRSWNPFNLFKKRKLKNHHLASDMANRLQADIISDSDLLKIASTIDQFEDTKLQKSLLCFLYSNIIDDKQTFITKKQNINQLSKILNDLKHKQYYPWWTLFLIPQPYYSNEFIDNLQWLTRTIQDLFQTRREKATKDLVNIYLNDELANQIISEYNTYIKPSEDTAQNELEKILDISLKESKERTQKELIKEMKGIVKNLPFGKMFISAAGLSFIITSYMSKPNNKIKPLKDQAQEIVSIIVKVVLKKGVGSVAKLIVPGVSDVAKAVFSVTVSPSPANPLNNDRKIGAGLANSAGAGLGAAVGNVIVPGVGLYYGGFFGAMLSNIAVTRFYDALESWQKAPTGPDSIVPYYNSSWFALIDNDAKHILEPVYQNYLQTESESKMLGNEIAKWLSIYAGLQETGKIVSEEQLEIVHEQLTELKDQFVELKNCHARSLIPLYTRKRDNDQRIKEYQNKTKQCLNRFHKPIVGMLDSYFPDPTKSNSDSSSSLLSVLSDSKNKSDITDVNLNTTNHNLKENAGITAAKFAQVGSSHFWVERPTAPVSLNPEDSLQPGIPL
ncbi:MAG: hypothetical protein M1486_02940 [Gammaproteobacteria bacterium]|nr:hypothetical protein [Gammaproteobacteria bacterium]